MFQNQTLIMNTKTVILANGEIPKHIFPLDILGNAKRIICCDGAITFLEAQNIIPDVIIGDCDSITETQFNTYQDKVNVDKNINYNDLQKALRYCIAQEIKEVAILGAAGLREDHFLANIGILMHYANDIELQMITNYGVFIPINKTTTFSSFPHQQISVFSFSPDVKISYDGLKYPVKNQKFTELWEGSLNENLGDEFTVLLNKSGSVLVYLVH